MLAKNRRRLLVEQLETRLVPAFSATYSASSDLWTITQTANNGDLTVQVDAAGDLIVSDTLGTATVGVAGANLTVKMQPNTAGLNVTLDTGITGNLDLQLNNGTRTVALDGTTNTVGGTLNIKGGTGDQAVELAANALLSVGNSTTIDLGGGVDSTTNAEDLTFGLDLTLRGVNSFEGTGNVIVGRNLAMYVNSESIDSVFNAVIGTAGTVGGNFTYLGSAAQDTVFMDFDYSIAGTVNINLGAYTVDSDAAVGDQTADLTLAVTGGSATVTAGLNTLGDDIFLTSADTIIGGSFNVNLGGGDNNATFLGLVGGTSITYTGGTGVDTVVLGVQGNPVRFTATLGAGADAFTLEAATTLSYMSVDFGADVDTYTNNFGAPYSFPVFLKNLP